MRIPDDALINKLPNTLPKEIINEEDQIAAPRENENMGMVVKETDPEQSFYKRVLDDTTVATLSRSKHLEKALLEPFQISKIIACRIAAHPRSTRSQWWRHA